MFLKWSTSIDSLPRTYVEHLFKVIFVLFQVHFEVELAPDPSDHVQVILLQRHSGIQNFFTFMYQLKEHKE